MSDLTSILVITGLGLGNIYLWWFIDGKLRHRLDIVASGVVRGVAMPKEHRRLSLWLNYLLGVGAAAGGQLVIAMCWFFAANNAGTDAKFLCFMGAWIAFLGAVGWSLSGIVWHRHLASALRQAEAD
jgi:hypothetical protein